MLCCKLLLDWKKVVNLLIEFQAKKEFIFINKPHIVVYVYLPVCEMW